MGREGIGTVVSATVKVMVRLEFHGATITSDAGFVACRELDDALELTETANCLSAREQGRSQRAAPVGAPARGVGVPHTTCMLLPPSLGCAQGQRPAGMGNLGFPAMEGSR